MDRNDAVKNIAMFFAMVVKYSRDVSYSINSQIIDYVDSEHDELPVGLQPYKDHVVQFKKIVEVHEKYILPIPRDMQEQIQDKFDEIGEDKFVEWFRKQEYTGFTSVEESLAQTGMFEEEMKDGA